MPELWIETFEGKVLKVLSLRRSRWDGTLESNWQVYAIYNVVRDDFNGNIERWWAAVVSTIHEVGVNVDYWVIEGDSDIFSGLVRGLWFEED